MESAKAFVAYNKILWICDDHDLVKDHNALLHDNSFTIIQAKASDDWKALLASVNPATMIFSSPSDISATVKTVISAKMTTKENPITTLMLVEAISPEEREKYFQAGGDELIHLPVGPNELLAKIKHFSRYRKDRDEFSEQIEEASQMALLAMENSSDLGGILNFVKAAMKADTYETLAKDIFAATSLYSQTTLVELRGHENYYYFSSQGSVDADMKRFMISQKSAERVVKSNDLIQINHPNLTLLLEGLPVQDAEKMGRISDTLVMLCDAANRFAKSLSVEETLQKAESSRRRFLTTLSHELRTPLNGILGFSKALKGKDEETPLGKSGIDALGRIFESTTQINAIITTLIDISSASMGTEGLHSKNFDISNIALKLETKFKPEADKKGISFAINYPDGLSMLSEETKVYSMLQHIVENAIKFTDQGAVDIDITTDSDEASGKRIIFTIKDTGIGIESKHHKRVFTEVGQLNNDHNRRHYGVGLGLYYVNLVAQQLNGNVNLQSELNKGSTFILDLPSGLTPDPVIDTKTESEQEIDDLLF